jgi:hypothetical protein
MLWLPLSCLLVPFALVWGGVGVGLAVLVGLGLAGLAIALWAILRLSGMSLRHLDGPDRPGAS